MNSKTNIVINYIKDNLNNGKWKTGDKLLSEVDLAKKLNVDKVTISNRMTSNAWKPLEVFYMKHALGFEL